MTINELRMKRNTAWNACKAFLEAHRTENGTLTAEDDAAYTRMEDEIQNLGKEIARLERQEALDAELNKPVNQPLTAKPMSASEDEKTGRASNAYKNAFWAQARVRSGQTMRPDVQNALQEGVDSEGGFLVPDEYEHTLVQALQDDNFIREQAHVITTSSGSHKIPVVASKGSASWIDEEGQYTESDDVFGQAQLDAHKIGTIIKVSQELLADSAFDLESYFTSEFTRRIGAKEEEAFLIGDGNHKPTGILNASGGAPVGITAGSATAITADELIDLFYSLKSPYRKNAVWVLNDATVKAIRKLKDSTGQYLWQPALKDGEFDTILGKRYFTSSFMPTLAAGAKTIAFGDFSYYWIGDRTGITFQRLNERFADFGQVGFLAYKRLDGKLILPEAIQLLKMKAS